MQLMYYYEHINLLYLYSVALYMNVIYLNIMSWKVHHLSSGSGTLGQIVTNLPSGVSLTPQPHTKKLKRGGG
jgi:hypothetical protein